MNSIKSKLANLIREKLRTAIDTISDEDVIRIGEVIGKQLKLEVPDEK